MHLAGIVIQSNLHKMLFLYILLLFLFFNIKKLLLQWR